ncbi:hypothetical protein AB832_01785 [Flavobacteriaceae bacterium (ex Bugula neritina AB1)]|nr:hypothetical protein AB832_01785 [Flavobacteriaceae bacterium (ex Bugula neritina AB1)]
MKFNKILDYLFGYRKSGFRITQNEIQILEGEQKRDTEEKFIVDVNTSFEIEHSFEALLLDIFEEAQEKSDNKIHNLYTVSFNTLESYANLLSKHQDYKRQFLLYLIQELLNRKNNKGNYFFKREDKVPANFKLELCNRILKSKIKLIDKDFIFLINFWKESYPFQCSLKSIIKHLKEFSNQDKISDELENTLASFLRSKAITYLYLDEYSDVYSSIQRIVFNNFIEAQKKDFPVFKLLTDYFGNYANQRIKKLGEKSKYYYSQILYKVCNFSNYYRIPEKDDIKINQLIETIGVDRFNKFSYDLLKRAADYKPRLIKFNRKIAGAILDDTYVFPEPMHKENIRIVGGIVLYAAAYKNFKCIPLIIEIIERSFSTQPEIGFGPTSRAMGKACIQRLAHNFGDKGQEELKQLYKRTKYKSIKTQVEEESKTLFLKTGQSLL